MCLYFTLTNPYLSFHNHLKEEFLKSLYQKNNKFLFLRHGVLCSFKQNYEENIFGHILAGFRVFYYMKMKSKFSKVYKMPFGRVNKLTFLHNIMMIFHCKNTSKLSQAFRCKLELPFADQMRNNLNKVNKNILIQKLKSMLLLNNSNNEEMEKLISLKYQLANVDNRNKNFAFFNYYNNKNEQWLLKYLLI